MKQGMIFRIFMGVALGVALQAGATEDRLLQAAESLRADIVGDTEALEALRAEIDAVRIPLVTRLETLQRDVAALREESARVRRLQQQGEREQAALVAAAASAEESFGFVQTVLLEYARSVETRAGAGESQQLLQALAPLRDALHDRAAVEGFADTAAGLLELAERWNRDRLGGHVLAGSALDGEGLVHDGRFVNFGPLAYFVANEVGAGRSGLVTTRFGSLEPGVHALDAATENRLVEVADGALIRLPVDVTDGDAIRIAQSRTGLIGRLRKGGFVMYPLLLTGLVSLVLALWKGIELFAIRRAVSADLQPVFVLLRDGKVEQAQQQASELPVPLSALVQEAIAHRSAPREHIEEILHEHVLGFLPRLERNLGALGVLGGVAPLLGLLGTVTGMIHTFQLVTIFGSGDARLLSGGISEALVTTETGLVIAVPVLLVHAFLMRRAREIVSLLERAVAEMVNRLRMQGESV